LKKPITIGVIAVIALISIPSFTPVFGVNYDVIDIVEESISRIAINGITSSSEMAVTGATDALYVFDKSMELVKIIRTPDSLPDAKFYYPKLFNSKLLVTAHLDNYAGCKYVRIILLYDINSGNLLHEFTPLNPNSNASCPETYGMVYSISNDKVLVTQRNISTSQYLIGVVYVYSQSSGNLLYSLESPTPEYTPEMSNTDYNGIDEFHEGFGSRGVISEKYLVISEEKKTFNRKSSAGDVYVFNSNNGKLLRTITLEDSKNGYVRMLLISGDFLFLSSLETVFKYDLRNGNLIQTFDNPRENTYHFGTSIAVNNDHVLVGDWVGELRAGQAYLFDMSTGQLIKKFENPFDDRVVSRGAYDWGDAFGKTVSFLNDDILIHSPHYYDRGGSVFKISSSQTQMDQGKKDTVKATLNPNDDAQVVDITPSDQPVQKIPDWVKNTMGWYADGLISEDEIISAIKYLVNEGIIKLD